MPYAYGKKPSWIRNFFSQLRVLPLLGVLLLVLIPVVVLFMQWAISFKGTQANPALTRQTLKEKGYTDIMILGSTWTKCPREFIGQEFEATNNGVNIKGFACCWEKANGCLLVISR